MNVVINPLEVNWPLPTYARQRKSFILENKERNPIWVMIKVAPLLRSRFTIREPARIIGARLFDLFSVIRLEPKQDDGVEESIVVQWDYRPFFEKDAKGVVTEMGLVPGYYQILNSTYFDEYVPEVTSIHLEFTIQELERNDLSVTNIVEDEGLVMATGDFQVASYESSSDSDNSSNDDGARLLNQALTDGDSTVLGDRQPARRINGEVVMATPPDALVEIAVTSVLIRDGYFVIVLETKLLSDLMVDCQIKFSVEALIPGSSRSVHLLQIPDTDDVAPGPELVVEGKLRCGNPLSTMFIATSHDSRTNRGLTLGISSNECMLRMEARPDVKLPGKSWFGGNHSETLITLDIPTNWRAEDVVKRLKSLGLYE